MDHPTTTPVPYGPEYYVGASGSNYRDYADLAPAIRTGFFPSVRRAAQRAAAGAGAGRPSFLDIGCAFGFSVGWMRELGWTTTGIDLSAYAVARGAEAGTAGLAVASALDLPFPDDAFHLVTAIDVVEHLPPGDAARAVAETHRVLRPGGIALYATPNFLSNRHWNVDTPGFVDPDTTHVNYQSVASLHALFSAFARCEVSGHTPFAHQFRGADRWTARAPFNRSPVPQIARRLGRALLGRRIEHASYLHALATK